MHGVHVDASPARVDRTARGANLVRSPVVRLLIAARGLGVRGHVTFEDLTRTGFVVLDDRPGTEIVLGLVGRFWRPTGGLERVPADAFRTFDKPGYAKAVVNLLVAAEGAGTHLSTETRVACTDAGAERAFRRYWRLIGPFSGLIRRRWLATIKREAESR